MKIFRTLALPLATVLLVASSVLSSCEKAPSGSTQQNELLPTEDLLDWSGRQQLIAQWLQAVGIGVSPVLGTAAAGTLGYYRLPPERRGEAFLLHQPAVWITLWLLTGLLLFKDFVLTFFGALKMPLDALGVLAHGAAGVLGLGFLLPVLFGHNPTGEDMRLMAGDIALTGAMLFFYVSVFITSSALEVLILLNPVPLVDSAIRTLMYAVVTFFFAAALIHPLTGILAASPVLLFSLWMAGPALRFTRLGLTFALDMLSRRWRSTRVRPEEKVLAFATRAVRGVKTNQPGQLCRASDGSLEFRYRPAKIGPTRCVNVPGAQIGECMVGKALLAPCLLNAQGGSGASVLFRLPPRYRGHEREVGSLLGVSRVVDVSATRGLRTLFRGGVSLSTPAVAG